MPAQSRKKITISTMIPFLIIILFFSTMFWLKYRTSYEPAVTPPPLTGEGIRSVTLFFVADGTRLARESRDIDPCDDDAACLKSVLDELLNGPVGELAEAVPEGAIVDAARIEGHQATIEFSRAFTDEMLSGSSAEMLAVYSVVDTVAVNFPQVQTVKINVDGNSEVVLRHLDLSDPLAPDYSLEQSPSPETSQGPAGSNINRKGQ